MIQSSTTQVNFSLFINTISSRIRERNERDHSANECYESYDDIDDGLMLIRMRTEFTYNPV